VADNAQRSPAPLRESATPPAFRRVLCGVDGSPSALEAVRQATLLAQHGGELDLVCVREAVGAGRSAQANISEWRADAALKEAAELARDLGVASTSSVVNSMRRGSALIEHIDDHDLVAVGPHLRSRIGGILIGSTASAMIHESPIPVLAARGSRGAGWAPSKIVVASDGSAYSDLAVEIATRIARSHSSELLLVSVEHGHDAPALRDTLAQQSASLGQAAGQEVVMLTPSGDPDQEIRRAAEQQGASLIVLGSRGTSGLKALGSVSERVAHKALCSVLVARAVR
jgi:nucleotide-binding universal stress UspA family protein